MKLMPIKLAYVVSHPIQYYAPLFRELTRRSDVELRVYFCSRMGVEGYHDSGFNREVKWDVPLLDGYDHTFLPNLHPGDTIRGFYSAVNPTVGAELTRWGAEVVVIHGYALATMHIVLLHCRLHRIPVLVRGDSTLVARRSAPVRVAKALASIGMRRLLAGAVATGTHNARYWEHYGIPPERIWRAPFSVDNEFFRRLESGAVERAARWREELGLSADTVVIGFAGKLQPVKDLPTLIRAFGEAAIEGTALVLVGEGELRSELEALARCYPRATIRFTGFLNQSEMPNAFAMFDVLILSSRFEQWGLVVNEAMNLGCPVIVSDAVGCAPDLVHADNGWVFPARDVAALTAVLREALGGPDARARLAAMGEASRRRIASWGLQETAQGFVDAAYAVTRRGDPG